MKYAEAAVAQPVNM